jgi:hypothetical protein
MFPIPALLHAAEIPIAPVVVLAINAKMQALLCREHVPRRPKPKIPAIARTTPAILV